MTQLDLRRILRGEGNLPASLAHVKRAVALAFPLVLLMAGPAVGQDNPRGRGSSLDSRSSPFDPPTADVFVTDEGPGLDTGCSLNTSGPLLIDIFVDQVVGAVDERGYLIDAPALIAAGVIPGTVTVSMPAFDVDFNGAPGLPERDEVLFNGESLGFLNGDNDVWRFNIFALPITKIKFPAPSAGGNPGMAVNRIQVNIDTLNVARWCTAIDWVALSVPIRAVAFTLTAQDGNRIRVRDYASEATIDTIYKQSFDASCGLITDIGDYDDYPFSGPSKGMGGLLPGKVKLHAVVEQCSHNNHAVPQVRVDWRIDGTSRRGSAAWLGEGDITITLPYVVGSYNVVLAFTVDGKEYPLIERKLLVTWRKPLGLWPRLGWYEKATTWASGRHDEDSIMTSLLAGLYVYGGATWRYAYDLAPGIHECSWQDLVADAVTCNYSACDVFSDVLENMSAVHGIRILSIPPITGTHGKGFLTNVQPSFDPSFPGNAAPLASGVYDRYRFAHHSLRRYGRWFYDATFGRRYLTPDEFITANIDRAVHHDGSRYFTTDEGWTIYLINAPAGNGSQGYEYTPPPSTAGTQSGKDSEAALDAPSSDIEFTGNVIFKLIDDNADDISEALIAEVEVRLERMGSYRIGGNLEKDGQLVANQPLWEFAFPTEATVDEIAGTYTVRLAFSGEQIHRSAVDGPYELVLHAVGDRETATATLSTPEYSHIGFGESPARLTAASEVAVDSNGDGRLDFVEVGVDLSVRLREPLWLHGALVKAGATLVDTASAFELAPGEQQVALRFDGRRIRRSGLDGPYEGTVNLVDASGHTIDGIAFTTRPYAGSSFSGLIEPQGSLHDEGLDSDGNGLYERLRVTFDAQVDQPGRYRLTATLRGASSPLAVDAESMLDAAAGPAKVALNFPGGVIEALALDGPYTVDLVARDAATGGELDAVTLPGSTASYRSNQFEPLDETRSAIELTGNSSDFGVDPDGDGLYDQLHVRVELAMAGADVYEWSAELVDRNGTDLGFHTQRGSFAAGLNNIELAFDGEAIGRNGVDGPYFVRGLLIFGHGGGANLVSVDVATTQAYRFLEFEGSADVQPPQLDLTSEPTVLSPLSPKYTTIAVADFVKAVSDARDSNVSLDDVVIIRVSSDEPDDAPGADDGTTANDIVIEAGCRSVKLRAERLGGLVGNGRVYRIHVAVADASGNVGTASHAVVVPSARGDVVENRAANTIEGCAP
jgi:hypothetical protein